MTTAALPPQPGEALTLRALHQGLEAAGVSISYKSLSDLTGTDDVAVQLGARGGRNRMAFPPDAVEAVQGFLDFYRRRKGIRPHASRLLREFLKDGDLGEAVDKSLEEVNTTELQVFNQHKTDLATVMAEFIAAVKDVSPLREDCALTRSQAAVLLACPEASVSRYIRPLRRGIYRRSDVMRYLVSGLRSSVQDRNRL